MYSFIIIIIIIIIIMMVNSLCSCVELRSLMKHVHLALYKASYFSAFYIFPAFWCSYSLVLFQVVLDLPIFLVP